MPSTLKSIGGNIVKDKDKLPPYDELPPYSKLPPDEAPWFPGDGSTVATPKPDKSLGKGKGFGFFDNKDMQGLACLELPGANANLLQNELHPIFARKNWYADLPEACWKALQPILRFASRLVGEESLWPYWFQLIWGREALPEQSAACGQSLERFNIIDEADEAPEPLGSYQKTKVKQFLQTMIEDGIYRFECTKDYPKTYHGISTAIRYGADGRAARKNTLGGYNSVIRINRNYLDLLTAIGLDTLQISQSQLLRLEFALGKILLHELNHSIYRACCDHQFEPYLGTQVMPELGRAWETFTFSGTIWPIWPVPGFSNNVVGGIALYTPWPSRHDVITRDAFSKENAPLLWCAA